MNNINDIRIVALVKDAADPPERYVLIFTDSCRAGALQQLGRWAANADLSFTWHDAAVLAAKVREPAAASGGGESGESGESGKSGGGKIGKSERWGG